MKVCISTRRMYFFFLIFISILVYSKYQWNIYLNNNESSSFRNYILNFKYREGAMPRLAPLPGARRVVITWFIRKYSYRNS